MSDLTDEELRALLEAELAELSGEDDDEEEEDTKNDSKNDRTDQLNNRNADNLSSSTVHSSVYKNHDNHDYSKELSVDDNADWMHLMESAVLANERFQGLQTSLTGDFLTSPSPPIASSTLPSSVNNDTQLLLNQTNEFMSYTVNDNKDSRLNSLTTSSEFHNDNNALSIVKAPTTNSTTTSIDTTSSSASPYSSTFETTNTKNNQYNYKDISGNTSDNNNDQDDLIQFEVNELIQSMIEAIVSIERIIPFPPLKYNPLIIDLSLLPQILGDEYEDGLSSQRRYLNSNLNTSRSDTTNTSQNNIQNIESIHSMQDIQSSRDRKDREKELLEIEKKIKIDSRIAEEEAVNRRKKLQDKREDMEKNLSLLKNRNAAVSRKGV